MFSKCSLLLLITIGCQGFRHGRQSVIQRRVLKSTNENIEIADLQNIQQFKYFFPNENYNDFINHLNNNEISKIYLDTNYKQLVSVDNLNNDISYNHYHITNINPLTVMNIVEKASDHTVPVYFITLNPKIEFIQNIFSIISNYGIPLLSFFLIITLFSRVAGQFSNLNNNPFDKFTTSKSIKSFVKPNVTLESWAGSPEVIDECKEVISYLENKEIYKQIGAEMPKGILLEGPPGTGKTLLAKAIATETNSTFISISGSEFVEIFVGAGAAKVRDLFSSARQNKPCIIFIDEIDAVGKQRGVGLTTNDEREQTLNQILYEMDGFNNNDDIVILAATNRRDVLDMALLRPGRFDRIIKIPLPDKFSREKILDYYLSLKNLDKPFDVTSIAELTDGFSGAELKNLINEAAIISARNNYTTIREQYIFDAFEKSIVGLIKANATVPEDTRQRVAIHESGHLLLALMFKEYFEFKKASIKPTYNGAGGYTIFTEKSHIKEGGLYTKDILKKRLIISMGGKAAESVFYGNEFVSLGANQDLKQANNLAKRMIGNYGMGNELEVFFDENVGEDAFSNRGTVEQYSDATKNIIDKEKLDLVKEAYNEAKRLLLKYNDKLIYFSELLLKDTVIYNKDIIDDIIF